MKRKRLLITLPILAVLPSLASAQTPAPKPRDRARTFLVLRIAEALKLNDEEALKVSTIIRASDEHRQELIKQRHALEDKLREALAKQPVDTAALTPLISEGYDLDQKLALIPEESFRTLQKTLTVEQQAKLLLFRRELRSEIRRAIQERRHGMGARPAWQGRGWQSAPPAADE